MSAGLLGGVDMGSTHGDSLHGAPQTADPFTALFSAALEPPKAADPFASLAGGSFF